MVAGRSGSSLNIDIERVQRHRSVRTTRSVAAGRGFWTIGMRGITEGKVNRRYTKAQNAPDASCLSTWNDSGGDHDLDLRQLPNPSVAHRGLDRLGRVRRAERSRAVKRPRPRCVGAGGSDAAAAVPRGLAAAAPYGPAH